MGWSEDYDWTSPNTLRNKAKYGILADLSTALIERSSVIEDFGYSEEVKKNTPGWIPVANGISFHISTRSINYVLGNDSFLGQFADHTVASGGDFTNQPSFPVWSLAKLNTAIGYDKPDIFWPNSQVTAEWAWWAYSAINLLLWASSGDFAGVSWRFRSSGSALPSWGAAVGAFNAASWSGWSAYGSTIRRALHRGAYNTFTGNYYTARYASRLGAMTVPGSFSYKADAYTKFAAYNAPFDTYENNDYPSVNVNTLGRMHSDAVTRTGDLPEGLVEIGNFNTVTSSNPSSAPGTGNVNLGWDNFPTEYYFVRKYDVEDGFDFVPPEE